ncbi:PBSX family phage terminase large subunit [Acutalibacter sp. 1XD8-33]|uniref:PBSX family phage terminase large subunit n=1 Tax=Acutalibacter sp. 1XD8-33 TaxID=2320081 RepID=UPI000EA049F5|nr:PBSX family phage terminase large subunit [Acutalibacter sp. 1XD8-33]RKJ40196.1 PBSX family phage terminase large subunit [Acutalibacter sp. 1XD8-33]
MISDKQKKILAFPHSSYEVLICDGAVRSGKTSLMAVAFIDWAMREFSGQRLGICGKTVDSAVKNIVVPYLSMSYAKSRYTLRWRRSQKILEVRRGRRVNWFEVFGGKDEAAFMLVQGRTLAGAMLDEVVLMPESFVNQAVARCSVEGSRIWFSCNPGPPNHWFKTEWIDQREKHNALYLHFDLTDNPALSQKIRDRYQRTYTGVFHDRYVKGLWVAAEGRIYPMFDPDRHVLEEIPPTEGPWYVSTDFGIQNATVFLLWRKQADSARWICLGEYYYSGAEAMRQRTTAEHVEGLRRMLDGISPRAVIVDPSAAPLKVQLRRVGYHVRDGDNRVLEGLDDVGVLLQNDLLAFAPQCENTIREFPGYVWDSGAAARGEDAPLKSGDHCMDAVRYFVRTQKLVRRSGPAV